MTDTLQFLSHKQDNNNTMCYYVLHPISSGFIHYYSLWKEEEKKLGYHAKILREWKEESISKSEDRKRNGLKSLIKFTRLEGRNSEMKTRDGISNHPWLVARSSATAGVGVRDGHHHGMVDRLVSSIMGA